MRQTGDRVPAALTAPPVSSVAELVRRLAVASVILTALTVLASIALTIQN
jgi:hypothetical protein